ncbi:hypothetical protein GCM10008171_33260 [Methylopila jiangsuensis]|uniref:Uncharacterized protein n=1 Tax=Methylopila jiangsuensis TaxID=586230 RepID=A0A9W6N5B8_9HYPH|nr:hypothetical protein GCM10008171_33260 [Methylopila jiangsuensis]
MPARFPAGTFERIDGVLEGQTRTAFVQEAVEREIKRRERKLRLSGTAWHPDDERNGADPSN